MQFYIGEKIGFKVTIFDMEISLRTVYMYRYMCIWSIKWHLEQRFIYTVLLSKKYLNFMVL